MPNNKKRPPREQDGDHPPEIKVTRTCLGNNGSVSLAYGWQIIRTRCELHKPTQKKLPNNSKLPSLSRMADHP
jgi:hypothetical protein